MTALLTEVLYEKYRGQLDEHYQSSSELKVKSGIFSDLTESSVLFCSFDFVMEQEEWRPLVNRMRAMLTYIIGIVDEYYYA